MVPSQKHPNKVGLRVHRRRRSRVTPPVAGEQGGCGVVPLLPLKGSPVLSKARAITPMPHGKEGQSCRHCDLPQMENSPLRTARAEVGNNG